MSKELLTLALEAVEIGFKAEQYMTDADYALQDKAVAALREALAEPDFWEGYVPEPVKPAQYSDIVSDGGVDPRNKFDKPSQDSGVVTAGGFDPRTQRTWVGLTDEEIESIFNNWPTYHLDHEDFAEAIEAKLKEKNT